MFGPLREKIRTTLDALESLLVWSNIHSFIHSWLEVSVAADRFGRFSKQAKRAEEMAAAKVISRRLVALSRRRRVLLLLSERQRRQL